MAPELPAVDFVSAVAQDDHPERFVRVPAVLQQPRQILLQPGIALEVQGLNAQVSKRETGSPDEYRLDDVLPVCTWRLTARMWTRQMLASSWRSPCATRRRGRA